MTLFLFRRLNLLLFLLLGQLAAHAQYTVKGTLKSALTKLPIESVAASLVGTDFTTRSDDKGAFLIKDVPSGTYTLQFDLSQYVLMAIEIKVDDASVNLGELELVPNQETTQLDNKEDFIPTITLSDGDLDQESSNQQISSILSASRDVFISAAAFTFGPMRFRIRGLDSENTEVLLNNVPINNLENGRVIWAHWGGLNDVMRNQDIDIGLGPISYTFGGLGGATSIDTRASVQRKQIRLTASLSNRSFRNRLMATYSTGMLSGGWAFSFAGSRRWADEGYVDATFYDSWSYFASIDRKFNRNHLLNFTALGSPTKRGRIGASTQEMYDIAQNNYYNPNWGYQNGEKRNSRVAHEHEPVLILRHDWTMGTKAYLTTTASYQFGQSGSTALDWFDAPDPRPDYYRYLPSYFEANDQPEAAAIVLEELSSNEAARQIDWERFYDVNRNSLLTEKYAYLLEGQNYQGKWSQYIVEDRRLDKTRAVLNANYQNTLNENVTLHFGANYIKERIDNYKLVDDLLGGDFYVNVDKFAVRDSVGNLQAQQNDLNQENIILKVGDRFGYDFEEHITKARVWGQTVLTWAKFEAFFAGELAKTSFWRVGNNQNGKFPDISLGKSATEQFLTGSGKVGFTYKIDGRNYLVANGAYLTRAPFYTNAFVSPRTRSVVLPGLKTEQILGFEGGYLLRSPNIKARAMVYLNTFENQVEVIRFYNDFTRSFGNYVLSGVNKRHTGLELALEYKINPSLTLNGVAAIGEYIYSNNATGSIYVDNADVVGQDAENFLVYSKNYRVSGMPQQAYTFGINYNSPKFWFVNLNFNYFRSSWIDFNPVRRTAEAVVNLDPDGDQYKSIIRQEETDPAFTMDFFGGKSFKFGKNFIYINVGVNNILDKKDFRTGGYEQLRFDLRERDVDTFPTRYFYAFGRNYFINLSYRY